MLFVIAQGDGSDGALTAVAPTTIPTVLTKLSASAPAAATTITVSSIAGFASGKRFY